MTPFEEWVAASLKRIVIWLTVVSLAVIVGVGLATWGLTDAQSGLSDAKANATLAKATATALAASVHSKNHVKDILLWCDAINATRSYDRAFVKRVTKGEVSYTLGLLPCEAIADKTRAITK